MSKQIRGNAINADRDVYDFYPTDPRWTKVLVENVDLGEYVWECAAGEGHMVKVLEAAGYKVMATDVQGDYPVVDFLSPKVNYQKEFAIVTNPPYKLLDEFILQALDKAGGPVAMLASLQALGGKGRTESVWTQVPPSLVIVIPDRMVVNGKASQFCHAWYVWDKDRSPNTRIIWKNIEKEA